MFFSAYTTPVTAQFGACLEHQVPDLHIGMRAADGAVRALCDEWIVPAPMNAPVGRPCPACAALLGHRTGGPTRWRVVRRRRLLG